MPRLAYVVSQYPMLSMIFVLREVLELRRLGFEVDVASINRPDRPAAAMSPDEAAEAARAYCLKQHGVRGALAAHAQALLRRPGAYLRGLALIMRLSRLDARRWFMNAMYFTEALMVGAWMRGRDHHHLHAHLGSQAATVGLFVREVFGLGFSMTVHGPDEFYDAEGQYLRQKVEAADFVCCISHFARSQLMKLSAYNQWSKLVVVRLGVDTQAFAPAGRAPAAGPFEVVCVGRLTPAKGQHLLVDAVARIAQQGGAIRLRVIGAGPDMASLRSQIERLGAGPFVQLDGAVNPDRIRDVYASAHCFCIASFAEGIPVVLMEAMAMGLPCVATRITGIPELIRDGIDGLLVAPSDVDGLAAALRLLMDDPALRERLGRSGRERVLEQYDLQRNVGALGSVFRARVTSSPTAALPRSDAFGNQASP